MNGAWGVLAAGLFADGTSNYGGTWNGVTGNVTGLFFGDPGQFVAQVIGVITCFVYVGGLSYIFFRIVDRVIGMRTAPEAEMGGLDIPEMGAYGYPIDFPGTGPAYPVVAASANGLTTPVAAPPAPAPAAAPV